MWPYAIGGAVLGYIGSELWGIWALVIIWAAAVLIPVVAAISRRSSR